MEIAYSNALREVKRRLCPFQTISPPNRLETTNHDLLLTLFAVRKGNPRQALIKAIRKITGQRHVILAPSGRAAIAQILSLLPHQEVVMPAYTCPAVKTAAEVAGKRIIYVDCSEGGLNATSAEFEIEAKEGRVLIPTHIFGLPTDIDNISALAKERGCVTIEDAAAYFPMRANSRNFETMMDFSVFSFERSKRLPAFRGAVITVNNGNVLDPENLSSHDLVPMKDELPIKEMLFSLLYNTASQPWLYGRISLPRILNRYRSASYIEKTHDISVKRNSPFFNRTFHGYQAKLILRVLDRWEAIGQHIKNLVEVYKRIFTSNSIRTFINDTYDEKALLRFPIAIPMMERSEFLRRALKCGLYLETNFEIPIAPKDEHRKFPNACWAAENVVLLPLYSRLSLDTAETIARHIVDIAEKG